MKYDIIAANKNSGSIVIRYFVSDDKFYDFNMDVPVVDGQYLSGKALDDEILARAPVWLVERNNEIKNLDFSSIENLVKNKPMTPPSTVFAPPPATPATSFTDLIQVK